MMVPMLAPMMAFDASAETSTGWDGVTVATKFAGGSGTSSSPYRISTPEQLAYMAKVLNDPATANRYYNKVFRLDADIDLGGKEWTPISNTTYTPASGTYRFKGTFDGNGHTISNFYIGQPKAAGTGLFGITQGATLKNFTLQGRIEAVAVYNTGTAAAGAGMLAPSMFDTKVTDVTLYVDMDIRSNDQPNALYIGAFTGYTGLSSTPTTLTNCHAYGNITVSIAHAGYTCVGGLVSHAKAVTITGSTSDVDIYVKNAYSSAVVGGILGDNYSDADKQTTHKTTITGCMYTGNIYAYSSGDAFVGGIVGLGGRQNTPTSPSLTGGGTLNIKSCAFDGTLQATSVGKDSYECKGAIIGLNRATISSVENCFTTSEEPLVNLDPNMEDKYGNELTYTDKGGHVTNVGLESEFGVSIRLTTGSSGLRYTSMIDRTLYDTLTARSDLQIKLGTIIAPTTYVEGAGGFTFEKLQAYKKKMGHTAPYLDVPFVLGTNSWLDSQYSNAEEKNLHYFSGAITNILPQNYNRSFSGVGYLSITTADGYSFTFYGDYTDAARARTVSYVATRALADLKDTQSDRYPYQTPDGKYSPYSATKRTKIDAFAQKFDAATVNTDPLTLIANGQSDYSIVYPLGGEAKDRDLAIYLQQIIRQLTGVSLPIYESFVQTGTNAKEIVVGCPERAGAYNFNMASLENGYRIFTDNERVILLGDTPTALGTAVRTFVKKFLGVDLSSALPTPISGATVTIPRNTNLTQNGISDGLLNFNASAYKIVYNANNEVEKRMAYSLRDSIALATGGKIEYTDTVKNNKTYADRTLVGGTQLPVATVKYGTRFEIVTNAALKDGDFRVTTSTFGTATIIKIEAGSYYGFEGAEDYILSEMIYGISNIAAKGFQMNGNFEYWLTRLEESSKYAYNQMGDARVMFYNVLFGTTAASGGNYTAEVPTAERNRLQVQMIAQYLPDVLGCQEFNKTKRDDSGSDNLATLLAGIGYVEAVDPRVKNAYATNQYIPGTDAYATTGANAGTALKGYGTSGATLVTVNGESYYTFYNNSPLFYNSNTTKLITAEYYWYKNQWDKRAGQNHSNSAMDCGSKAATWGLFEDIEFGNQYIVISTHMCTRSDYVRGLQARELTALVDQLTALYNVPVFFGGDMNGSIGSQNINHFLFEKNYVDALNSGICTEFASSLRTSHSYPDLDTMDKNVTMMQPSNLESTEFYGNSIDRILLTNHSGVTARVFGVVSDDFTRSASDHYPVFLDFDFNTHVKTGPVWTGRY